ncbi:hypothetical protein BDK92_1393 [Micromonospora pisi]|uniref:Peptidase inhibitor family I36 n=1 Tax=Micromonospora pisi TaxID=589240 RepID=A0A495JDN1_9ACTN|nr:hypothetical protein [Micromonospora pisi]RKR87120.1 hypothetical protein BDK92_1393 [Micromonospora pisi]
MRLRKPSLTSVLASASAAAMASAAFAAPAYAAPTTTTAASSTCSYADGTVCFNDSIWFTGQEAEYAAPLGTGCANTPITIHGWVNLTSQTLKLYRGANCTGTAITVPVSDLHTSSTAYLSFKVA